LTTRATVRPSTSTGCADMTPDRDTIVLAGMLAAIVISGGFMLLAIISETLGKYFPDAD
jgi:predicted DNA-binding protein (UPF0278 family)